MFVWDSKIYRFQSHYNNDKFPKVIKSLSVSLSQPLSSEENCLSTHSSQSDSQYGSPPRGWSEELDEHGHTLYVCEYNNEKVLVCCFSALNVCRLCIRRKLLFTLPVTD